MLINDRLSTILTQHAGEMAFVQRSQSIKIIIGCKLCMETSKSPTAVANNRANNYSPLRSIKTLE